MEEKITPAPAPNAAPETPRSPEADARNEASPNDAAQASDAASEAHSASASASDTPSAAVPVAPAAPAADAAPHKPFPTIGDILAMLGIVLGITVVVGLLFSLVGWIVGLSASPETEDPTLLAEHNQNLGRFFCLSYLVTMSLALVGILLYRHKRGDTERIISFSLARLNPIMLLWACIFLFAVGIVLEPMLDLLPAVNPPVGTGLWAFAALVIFAPLLEEFICRGVVLGSLRKRFGVVVAWLGSSLFFGIMHLYPAAVINACIMGLILGYIYLLTNSIWSSVILHAVNNAVAWLLLTYGGEQRLLIDWMGADYRWLYWVVYIGALGIAGFSAYKTWQAIRRMKEAEKMEAHA